MQWISADIVFDGFAFQKSLYLFVDDEGMLLHKQKDKPSGDVKMLKGLLMPGLVNAHCHLELSYMKGRIDKGLGLVGFLRRVNEIIREHDTRENTLPIQEAITEWDNKMYNNGISVVGDICNNTDSIAQKTQSKIFYHNFIETICIDPEHVEDRFFHYSNVYYEFQQQFAASLSLHAPYTCCDELYEEVSQRSNFISIHNQESQAENDLFHKGEGDFVAFLEKYKYKKEDLLKNKSGIGSLQRTMDLLNPSDKILLVHNTYTSEEEIMRATDSCYWCFCPKANLYIENRLPNIPLFLSHTNKIVLGTDSLASNDDLNLIAEIKTIQDTFPAIPLQEILRWATSNGAMLFDVEEKFGSFSLGSTPGYLNVPNIDLDRNMILSDECHLLA